MNLDTTNYEPILRLSFLIRNTYREDSVINYISCLKEDIHPFLFIYVSSLVIFSHRD